MSASFPRPSYSYRVRAEDAVPNVGDFSNTASATTLAPPDTEPPSAPGTLSATASSTSQIDLSWGAATDNVAVTLYRIERCQGAGCSNFAEIATTSSTTYPNTGLSASTSYSYRVRAEDAVPNVGDFSNTASATTLTPPDTEPPSAPGTLERDRHEHEPDRSQLGGGDRQRRGDALPHRALPGSGLLELRRDRDDLRDDLPEHRPQRLDLVLLPRPRPGRRPQRRGLLEHRQRDDARAESSRPRSRFRLSTASTGATRTR